MNRHFLNSFDQINLGQLIDIQQDLSQGKLLPKQVTPEDREQIEKYLLKNEYIQSVKDNTIIVSTSKSKFVITYYNKLMTLGIDIDYYTCNRKGIQNFKKVLS